MGDCESPAPESTSHEPSGLIVEFTPPTNYVGLYLDQRFLGYFHPTSAEHGLGHFIKAILDNEVELICVVGKKHFYRRRKPND